MIKINTLSIFFWGLVGVLFGLSVDIMIFIDLSSQPDFIGIGGGLISLWLIVFGFLCFLFNWMTRITILVFFFLLFLSSLIFGYGFNSFSKGVAGMVWQLANYYQTDYVWSWIFGILGGLVGISVIWFVRKEKSQQTGE